MELGYNLEDYGDHWRTRAVYRGGKNASALQIYKDSGVWIDYGGDNEFRKLSDLLNLSNYTGTFTLSSSQLSKERELISMEEKLFTEDSLRKLIPNYSFYMKKNISEATLRFFKGGVAMSGSLYGRFVFPIYKQNRVINGFSGRDVLNRDQAPKWKHFCNRRLWAYPFFIPDEDGVCVIDEKIRKSKEIVLMESIGDALNCFDNGIKNIGVTFGLDISKALLGYLLSLDADRIVLSTNNDNNKEGLNSGFCSAIKNYLILSQFFSTDKLFICLPTKNDFGDMKPPDFSKWSSKKEKILADKDQVEHVVKAAEKMIEKKQVPQKYRKIVCQIK